MFRAVDAYLCSAIGSVVPPQHRSRLRRLECRNAPTPARRSFRLDSQACKRQFRRENVGLVTIAVADLLLVFVVVAAFVAITAFIGVAMASDDSHQRYPGTKLDRFRDIIVMNLPAAPFFALLLATFVTGLEHAPYYTVLLAACAGCTLAGHFVPPVKRARDRWRKAYAGRAPWS